MTRPLTLITGVSRSKGIGAAVARKLAMRGHDLYLTHWSPFDGTEGVGEEPDFIHGFVDELRASGARVVHEAYDLASGDVEGLLDRVEAALGTPSRLINNATYERHVSVDTFTMETLRRHYLVNNEGTLGLTFAFLMGPDGAWVNGQHLHVDGGFVGR